MRPVTGLTIYIFFFFFYIQIKCYNTNYILLYLLITLRYYRYDTMESNGQCQPNGHYMQLEKQIRTLHLHLINVTKKEKKYIYIEDYRYKIIRFEKLKIANKWVRHKIKGYLMKLIL